MPGHITSSSRASDLIHVLSDPIQYVRGIVTNFAFYGYDRETSAIRLGMTGAGILPNYKIQKPSRPVTITVGSLRFKMTATPGQTFSGRNHR